MRCWLTTVLFLLSIAAPMRAQGLQSTASDTATKPAAMLTMPMRDSLLGEDKAHHALLSVFLAAAGYYLARDEASWSKKSSVAFAAGFSFSFGVGKEVYDKRSGRGHASIGDLVADVAGLAFGLALFAGHF
ncbi:MAG: hypothetical protein QHJ34_05130 [bacterium]|jgi:putative lipoprotein|nr:hypothetical protein [candidate division KSB1 bacterium]MDH7559601.1 hypothetical protein [bacterium]